MNIVLLEPEIPANTGNIGRSCVATGSMLHLIGPLGFSLEEKQLKRAGLDYWPNLNYRVYGSFEAFLDQNPAARSRMFYATTKAHRLYTEPSYRDGDYLMFGKESAGIPEEILVDHEEMCVRIPMKSDIRSLNLSNSVAIVLFEALRQQEFAGQEPFGALHRLHWKREQ